METIRLEYTLNCSQKVLFGRLSTVEGLSEWFADNVNIKGKNRFEFEWDGSHQTATIDVNEQKLTARYDWEDEDDGYFQFTVIVSDMTKELSLIVEDSIDDGESEESQELWDKQIDNLRKVIGY